MFYQIHNFDEYLRLALAICLQMKFLNFDTQEHINFQNNLISKIFQQMQYIASTKYVDQAIRTFFKPIRLKYDQQMLNYILDENQNIRHQQFYVTNRHNEKLIGSLITPRNIQKKYQKYEKFVKKKPELCILYLHGFGSNRFECLNILNNPLPENYALCSFDFSASGMSEGTYVTYGNKQKSDIQAVVNYLKKQGIKKFVLWGRSMGATSAILYNAVQQSAESIVLQVLDAPFTTLQSAAKEVVSKRVKVPDFAFDVVLNLVKTHCKKYQYNAFQVNALKDIEKCVVPSLFVFSKNDSVLSYENTQQIIKNCRSRFQKIQIEEDHNHQRSKQTIAAILSIIQKYLRKKQKVYQAQTNRKISIQAFKDDKETTFLSTKQGLSTTKSHEFLFSNSRRFTQNTQIISNRNQNETNNFNQYGLKDIAKLQQHSDRDFSANSENFGEFRPTLGKVQSQKILNTIKEKEHNHEINRIELRQRKTSKKGILRVQADNGSQGSRINGKLNNGVGLWMSIKFDQRNATNLININGKQRSRSSSHHKQVSRHKKINGSKNLCQDQRFKKSQYLNSMAYCNVNKTKNERSLHQLRIHGYCNEGTSRIPNKSMFKTAQAYRQKPIQRSYPIGSSIFRPPKSLIIPTGQNKSIYFDCQIPHCNKMDSIIQESKSKQSSLVNQRNCTEFSKQQNNVVPRSRGKLKILSYDKFI